MDASRYECKIWSPPEGRLHVTFRFRPGNRAWLRAHGLRAEWDSANKCWYISRSKINVILNALITDMSRCPSGEVLVIRDGRVAQKCDIRCQSAKGHDCSCACAGKFHGTLYGATLAVGTDTVFVVGEEINRSFTVVRRSA